MMASFNRTRCRAAAILFLVVASAVGSSSGASLRSRLRQKEMETSTPTPANLVYTQKEGVTEQLLIPEYAETEDSTGFEKEEDGTFRAEDLLIAPIIESASLLAQLMSLSMQNLDTAFKGTSKNQQSPIAQHVQSFRTTMLQIIQKLSNAFSISRTNADEIKMRIVYGPSKVNETIKYLKELENSNSTLLFGVLHSSTMHLKEITDQTFNLSSQISNHFEELVQLVDEVIKSHNLSKSNKEQQVRNTTEELMASRSCHL